MTTVKPLVGLHATPNQVQLYFLQQLHPDSHFYNVAFRIDMDGPLDTALFSECVEALVRRHEGLRTTFTSAPEAGVHRAVMPLRDWRVLRRKIPGTRELLTPLVQEAAREIFDLEHGPLVRAYLFASGPEEHTFVFVLHHIVVDAWSVGVMLEELSVMYEAAVGGVEHGLAPAVSPDQISQNPHAYEEKDLKYWLTALTDQPAFGLSNARSGLEGAYHRFRLNVPVTQAVRATATRNHCSVFMVLMAALRHTLGRRFGIDDLTIGIPVAGRDTPEAEKVVGFMVNTLPVRTVVSHEASATAVLQAVREAVFDAFQHRRVPLEKIVSGLSPQRRLLANPLFDVTCQQQNAAEQQLGLPGVESRFSHVDKGTSQFALSLDVYDEGEEIECTFEYATELFPDVTELESQYRQSLNEVLGRCASTESPQRPNGETGRGGRGPDTVSELSERLERALYRTPERTALITGDRAWSYSELSRSVDEATTELEARGVRCGHRVAVAAPRSAEGIVLMLAVLRLGAAYCPLDERLNDTLTSTLLRQLRPKTVVGPASGDWQELVNSWEPAVDPRGTAAYIVHTSGSSGSPSAVTVAHTAFVRYLDAVQECYGLTQHDRVLHFASPGFDVGIEETVPSLLSGGAVVIPSEILAAEPGCFLDEVYRAGVTVLNLPSSFWHRLTDTLPQTPDTRSSSSTLRLVVIGSEFLRPQSVLRWRAAGYGGVRLLHAYGLSEGTVTVAVDDITQTPIDEQTERLPIGRALSHAELTVVDREGRPVTRGAVGNIALSGDAVCTPDGDATLVTEDSGRFLPDGRLELLGRMDRRFKRSGVLVDPERIEHYLTRTAGVGEAHVGPGPDGTVAAVLEVSSLLGDENRAAEHTRVTDWAVVHDEESFNEHALDRDPTLNTSGWLGSVDRKPMPDRVMAPWVADAVTSVRAFAPKRVLEIGCGTGMLLFRLAPETERYVGLDVSRSALAYVERTIAKDLPEAAHTELFHGQATDLAAVGIEGKFDAVVIHSVAQYFPNSDYLVSVLGELQPFLTSRAVVHVGDVRGLELRRGLYRDQALHRFPGMEGAALVAAVEESVNQEEELLLSPEFFFHSTEGALRPIAVEVCARRPWPESELNRYRFDVRLFHGDWTLGPAPVIVEDPADLEAVLDEGPESAVLPTRPHPLHTASLLSLTKSYEKADLTDLLDVDVRAPGDDVDLWRSWFAVAARAGYNVLLPYGPDAHHVDVTFVRRRASGCARLPLRRESRLNGNRRGLLNNFPLRAEAASHAADAALSKAAAELGTDSAVTSRMLLERLPRISDGQVLRRPLGELLRYATPYEAPDRAPAEHTSSDAPLTDLLTREWCAVLGQKHAYDEDHFFGHGGNSILALRLVTRLRRLGFQISPADVFRHQTLGALRAELRGRSPVERPETGSDARTTIGPVERFPMASWFWEQEFSKPDSYHQSVAVELRHEVDPGQLCEHLERIVERHPALRSTSTAGDDVTPETVRFVLTERPLHELGAEVDSHRNALASKGGVSLLAVYTPGLSRRLVLVAHHLRVDTVSWNLILDDLDHLLKGQRLEPEWSQNPSGWLQRMSTDVNADRVEASYWHKATVGSGSTLFPVKDCESRLHWSSRTLLGADQVDDAERATGGTLEALLFTAVVRALATWRGHNSVTVDREVHGRDALELDASDIVGWLASSHPMRLTHHPDPSRALAVTREVMDGLPHNGSRFLAHRFLSSDPVPRSPAEVCLTYTGRAPKSGNTFSSFYLTDNTVGRDVHPANTSTYAIDILICHEGGGLVAHYAVDTARVSQPEAREFGEYLARAVSELAVGPDELLEELTPTQTSMLLHSIARPDSLVGAEQTIIDLRGGLCPRSFAEALNRRATQYDLIRSSFHVYQDRTVRRVHREATVPVETHDLSGLSRTEQARRILDTAAEDLRAGVDPTSAPTMRWTLFACGEDKTTLVWTHHHLILDGEGAWRFLGEVLADMEHPTAEPVPAPLFSEFVRWEAAQRTPEAYKYWAQRLKGLKGPCLLFPDRTLPSATGHQLDTVRRPLKRSHRVDARALEVTPGTVYLAAWLLIVSRICGREDVVCGTTTSHRPQEEAFARTAGMYAVTVPIRAQVDPDTTLGAWVRGLQECVAGDLFFSRVGPEALASASGISGSLYDTHFLYQNYPRVLPSDTTTRITSARTVTRTGLPLTLSVEEGQEGGPAWVELVYDSTVVDRDEAMRLLEQYLAMVELITGESGTTLRCLGTVNVLRHRSAPPSESAGSHPGKDGARNAVENTVGSVFAELLGLDEVPATTPFFDIGARSIVLVRAHAELQRHLGLDFPLTHLFEYPTVRDLSAALSPVC